LPSRKNRHVQGNFKRVRAGDMPDLSLEAASMAKKAIQYGIGTNSLEFRLTAIYVALAAVCLALATMPFLSEHSVSDLALHMKMALAGLIATAILMA